MTLANFRIALKGFSGRQPFRKFTVELVSGYRFRIDHPEALVLRGDVVMHVATNKAHRLFDSESVCQLCDLTAE